MINMILYIFSLLKKKTHLLIACKISFNFLIFFSKYFTMFFFDYTSKEKKDVDLTVEKKLIECSIIRFIDVLNI